MTSKLDVVQTLRAAIEKLDEHAALRPYLEEYAERYEHQLALLEQEHNEQIARLNRELDNARSEAEDYRASYEHAKTWEKELEDRMYWAKYYLTQYMVLVNMKVVNQNDIDIEQVYGVPAPRPTAANLNDALDYLDGVGPGGATEIDNAAHRLFQIRASMLDTAFALGERLAGADLDDLHLIPQVRGLINAVVDGAYGIKTWAKLLDEARGE